MDKIIQILEKIMPNVMKIPDDLAIATVETLYMAAITCLIAFPLGLLMGISLSLSMPKGLRENRFIYSLLDKFVNIFRAIPFVIVIALLGGLSRLIVRKSIGTNATLVPLVFSTIPFYARQIQNLLVSVDSGVIEAAESMGLSTSQIVRKVYLRETLPDIIRVSAVSIISVISLTAMAGTVAGGGLGNLAITRGYNRHHTDVTIVATILILLIVFACQFIADKIADKIDHSKA